MAAPLRRTHLFSHRISLPQVWLHLVFLQHEMRLPLAARRRSLGPAEKESFGHAHSSRLMKNGECRGAEPLCREPEGVPQIQISSLSSLERAPEGWSKEFFSALLGGSAAGAQAGRVHGGARPLPPPNPMYPSGTGCPHFLALDTNWISGATMGVRPSGGLRNRSPSPLCHVAELLYSLPSELSCRRARRSE